jgi:membrane-bound metal-dependent hydrolase YbcI (DUF457 family)
MTGGDRAIAVSCGVPSPLGHGLAAVAAGWIVAGKPETRPALLRQVAILVAVGVAPDVDLLIGRHSMETHSIGAAVIVATVAAWQRWPVAASRTTTWMAVALAWMSHPILDALGSDTSAPIGVMAFWPFSRAHVQSSFEVFGAISRRYWRDDFWSLNASAVGRELLILAPIVALVFLTVAWRRRRTAPGS